MAYEDTELNWATLKAYARRVARELGGTGPTTRVVEDITDVLVTTYRYWLFPKTTLERRTIKREVTTSGDRWLLNHRVAPGNRVRHGRGNYTDNHYIEEYHLAWNGDLVTDWESWEDGIADNRYWQGGKETGSSRMSEFSVLLFDHEGLNPTRPVWAPAKGAGLSARLTRLLNDRH